MSSSLSMPCPQKQVQALMHVTITSTHPSTFSLDSWSSNSLPSHPSICLTVCFVYFLCFPPAKEVFWSETSRDNHFVIIIMFNVTLCRSHYDLGYIYLKYIQITVPSVHELFLYNNYSINVCLI